MEGDGEDRGREGWGRGRRKRDGEMEGVVLQFWSSFGRMCGVYGLDIC
jgi:hypothetical protein